MGVNIYYLFASIYGWIRWNNTHTDGEEAPIIHTPRRLILPLSLITLLLYGVIYLFLVHFTDSPVAAGDSLTTALSVVGMWMLAQKHAEQWWVWFMVNIISCGLYLWKGLYPTSALFAIYTVISLFGYTKWAKLAKKNMASH